MDSARETLNTTIDYIFLPDLESEQKNAYIEKALSLCETIIAHDPDDFKTKFDRAFLEAYNVSGKVAKHDEALESFEKCAAMFFDALSKSEISSKEKAEMLADVSVKLERLLHRFTDAGRIVSLLAQTVARLNPNFTDAEVYVTCPDVLFKDASEGIIEAALHFGKIIPRFAKVDSENSFACAAYVAQKIISEVVAAPAFAYDQNFFNEHRDWLVTMVKVVKTSAPHEVYYIPEPDYSFCFEPFSDMLMADYKKSLLHDFITSTNRSAEVEAIQRYWEHHADEKKELEEQQQKLKKEVEESTAVLDRNQQIVDSADRKREQEIRLEKKKVTKTEEELAELKKQLSVQGLFQFTRKKELRAEIEGKEQELAAASKAFDEVRKKLDHAFLAETREARQAVRASEKAITAAKIALDKIQAKLKNPLQS